MANYEGAIPYIQKAEGGLSRATTDTASKDPSPYVYNGLTGWHTNRGITWGSFKTLAPKAGYEINENNFIHMPDDIWKLIYKTGYWNPMAGDQYNSQAIANAVVDFAWAAGSGAAIRALGKFLAQNGITVFSAPQIANGFNDLVNKQGEAKVFNDLVDYRKSWFVSLNQPANTSGWLKRMEALRASGSSLLGKAFSASETAVKHNPIKTIVITALAVFTIAYIYKKLQND